MKINAAYHGLGSSMRHALTAVLLGIASVTPAIGQDNNAGTLQHLQGLATAQQSDGNVRFLEQGDAIQAGDVISTTDKGFAVLALQDGSKITLRPATTFALDQYSEKAGEEAVFMRLLRGGMRAITGLLGKRQPGSVKLQTLTATVGVRGTSFDARLCSEDCATESLQAPPSVARSKAANLMQAQLVGRVVSVTGRGSASSAERPARPLTEGAPIYIGDTVRTETNTDLLIGFRDESRVTMTSNSVFRVNEYSFRQADKPNTLLLGLLKGGMRFFTGLIGKGAPENVKVQTVTATIGVRGTGLDMSCEGPCVDPSARSVPANGELGGGATGQRQGLFLLTWQGTGYLLIGDQTQDVPVGKTGFVGPDGRIQLLEVTPLFMEQFPGTRPDGPTIDWQQLFGTVPGDDGQGLYVTVRDGHVFIQTANGIVDLGVGETGFVGSTGDPTPVRLETVPAFMVNDPYPIPEFFSEGEFSIFQLYGVTLGEPGQEICRL